MEKNVGGYDRIARILGGVALLAIGWRLRRRPGSGRLGKLGSSAILSTGANLLATGVLQRCPGNATLGLNTREQGLSETLDSLTGDDTDGDSGGDGGRTVPIPTSS